MLWLYITYSSGCIWHIAIIGSDTQRTFALFTFSHILKIPPEHFGSYLSDVGLKSCFFLLPGVMSETCRFVSHRC